MRNVSRRRLGLAIAAATVFAAGCRRATGPDPRFERAFAAFVQAEGEEGDAVVRDSRADEALAAARAVSPSSIDHAAAQALVARIEKARRRQAAFAAQMKAAGQLPPEPLPPFEAAPTSAPEPSKTAPVEPPRIGSAGAAFHERYGQCVTAIAPFREKGGKRQGTAWALVPGCDAHFPELRGVAVAILDGRVFNVVPRSMFQTPASNAPAPPDAGTP